MICPRSRLGCGGARVRTPGLADFRDHSWLHTALLQPTASQDHLSQRPLLDGKPKSRQRKGSRSQRILGAEPGRTVSTDCPSSLDHVPATDPSLDSRSLPTRKQAPGAELSPAPSVPSTATAPWGHLRDKLRIRGWDSGSQPPAQGWPAEHRADKVWLGLT